MAKKKKDGLEISAKINGKEVDLSVLTEKPLLIVQGTMNDEFCNYGIQINSGETKGMIHNVKGKPNIVHEDLTIAFNRFRPHLAALSNAFDWSGIELDNFEEVENHQLVDLFHVTGFKIKGAGESESLSLTGSYHSMSAGGRIDASTDFISLEGAGDYRWYNELREAADQVRNEIELYNKGKRTPPHEEEAVPKNQKNLLEEIAETEEA